jgi:Family of unknown function (DUF6880)
LKTIEATEHRRSGWPDFEWEDARIDVLEALGRGNEAQAARWSCFERSLSARHLRGNLKRLPDFEDFDTEQRALGYAERYRSLLQAVSFLVSWPALDRAARVVIVRAKELDGDHYGKRRHHAWGAVGSVGRELAAGCSAPGQANAPPRRRKRRAESTRHGISNDPVQTSTAKTTTRQPRAREIPQRMASPALLCRQVLRHVAFSASSSYGAV